MSRVFRIATKIHATFDKSGLNSTSTCWHTRIGKMRVGYQVRWALEIVMVVVVGCAALASYAAIDDERRVALVIGNGAYHYADPLPNPRNDAEAISDKLEEIDFEVTTAVDLGRDEMEDAILRFGQESEGADVVLIFYAGHGMQLDGENYLLSVDAKLERSHDLQDAAIEEARLHSVFAFVEPELSLLILDACRTNPFHQTLDLQPGLASGGAATHELGSSRSTKDLLIVFSAAPGQVAFDGETGNSPFTTALLQWIDRPGLHVETLFRHVRRTVIELTGKQIPWVESSMTREAWLSPPDGSGVQKSLEELLAKVIESFDNELEREAAEEHFRRLMPSSEIFAESRLATSDTIASDAQEDLEALRWLSIRTSTDPAVFERFAASFPNGRFSELAQKRLETLGSASVETAEATAESALFQVASGTSEVEGEGGLDPDALAAAEAELDLDQSQMIAVQQLLAYGDHYSGALDGSIGPMSRSAITAFQGDSGLDETGYLNGIVIERLVALHAGPLLMIEQDPERRRAIHALAAVAGSGPGANPEVIRIASIARHPEVEAVWRSAANEFEADYPGNIVEFDTRPGDAYKADLLGMLGSDTPPDIVFTWGGGHLRALAHAGFASDLTEDMGSGLALQYKPSALSTLTIDERIFAAPANMSLVNLWANKTLLDKAGVDPDLLATWEGILAAVPRLKDAGVIPIGVGGADRWPVQGYWSGLALAIAGTDGIADAVAGEGLGFEDPAFVEAGERFEELVALDPFQENYRDLMNIDAVRAFIAGWTAMTVTGDWAYVEMSRNWPGGPEGASETLVRLPFPPRDLGGLEGETTLGGSDGWVLRSSAPEKALHLLNRLSGLEMQTELARLGHLVPSVSGADEAIEDPTIAAVATELALSRNHQLFLDQILGPEVGEKLNDVAVALADGDLTPENAAAEIESAWADARQTLMIRPMAVEGETSTPELEPVE